MRIMIGDVMFDRRPPKCCRTSNVSPLQVYNPTGFNKIEKFVKQNKKEMKVTVWDTSGNFLNRKKLNRNTFLRCLIEMNV